MPGLDHPALQLHQFALQAKQFGEVAAPGLFLAAILDVFIEQCVQVVSVFR
ncbi:hypothetical protein D3C86_1939320 [compost metagenome]